MPRGRPSQFVGERLQALLADMRAGMCSADLMEKYRCASGSLTRVRREHGVPGLTLWKHDLTPADLKEFKKDARAGLTIEKLRAKYHVARERATALRLKFCPASGGERAGKARRARRVIRLNVAKPDQDVLLALLSAGNNNYEMPYDDLRRRARSAALMTARAFTRAFNALVEGGLLAHDEETDVVRPAAANLYRRRAYHNKNDGDHTNATASPRPAHRVFGRRDSYREALRYLIG